jgi:hypothetical protein
LLAGSVLSLVVVLVIIVFILILVTTALVVAALVLVGVVGIGIVVAAGRGGQRRFLIVVDGVLDGIGGR